MAFVLDMPVLVPHPEQILSVRGAWVEARDRIMHRPNDQSGRQDHTRVLDAEHLADIGPRILGRQVARERGRGAHPVGREPSMPFDSSFVRSNGRLYTRARTGKEASQAAQQPWLIVFDPQKVVPLFSRMVVMTSRVV